MKLCVNARQEPKYIGYADEILFDYKDRDAIPDFIKKYPDKTIILAYYDSPLDLDWVEIINFNIISSSRFMMKIISPIIAGKCIENGIKFFFAQVIKSYDDLAAVMELKPQYVRLGAPLFFDLDNIHTYHPNVTIRLVPNVAYDDLYNRKNGIVGTWIRPEDIMMYDDYAETMEFENVNLAQERALIRIYWEQREWPGDLNMLIYNFNHDGVNRLLTSEFTDRRINCRQICKQRKHCCSICYRHIYLANEERLQIYKDSITTKYQAPKEENLKNI